MNFPKRLYLLPLLAVGATIACSDATAPRTEMRRAGTAANTHADAIAMGSIVKRTITLTADETATATITAADGGWLWMPQSGLVLYFPAGAVSADLQVTATAYKGNKVIYDFQPHGTQFAKPIYVAQMLLNTELNTPRAKNRRPSIFGGYLAHGLEDVVEDVGYFSEIFSGAYGGKGSDTYAVFTTTHFSGYALASGRSSRNNDNDGY